MTTPLAWLTLVAALISAFGSSIYLGFMIVVQFFLRRVFLGLHLEELPTVFAVPITLATRFLGIMFLPFLVAAPLTLWLSWGTMAAYSAGAATAAYFFLAIWFALAMRPVNHALLTAQVRDERELGDYMRRWLMRNRARVVASIIYWGAAMGFLITAAPIWEEL